MPTEQQLDKVITKYNLSAFNLKSAERGYLCILIVNRQPSGFPQSIDTWDPDYRGVGICKIKNGIIYISIAGITYAVKEDGTLHNPPEDNLHLYMATVSDSNTAAVGNAIKIDYTAVTEKSMQSASPIESVDSPEASLAPSVGEDAEEAGEEERVASTNTVITNTPSTVVIDNLNARDHFAIEALGKLMSNMEDPSSVSKDSLNYYCNAAYEWASGMMKASAKARATFDDQTAQPTTTPTVVGELENNTEKLLNNLIATMERTIVTLTENSNSVDYQRSLVSIPDLINVLRETIVTINNVKYQNCNVSGTVTASINGAGSSSSTPLYVVTNSDVSTIDARVPQWLNACSIIQNPTTGNYELLVPVNPPPLVEDSSEPVIEPQPIEEI